MAPEPSPNPLDRIKRGKIYGDREQRKYLVIGLVERMVRAIRLDDGALINAAPITMVGSGRPPSPDELELARHYQRKHLGLISSVDGLRAGQVVRLNPNSPRILAAAEHGEWDSRARYVIIKVNDKSVNIVPLGGHGVAAGAYLRVAPAHIILDNNEF